MAHRGIENIALNFELFTWIIVVSFVLLAIFGAAQTNYSVILPFESIDIAKIVSTLKPFTCWFGDFFLVLYLGVKARDIKLSKTLGVYSLSMLFVAFLVVVFTGIYDKTAAMAPGLISVISEQSLLDISIGRIDWFLILFTEMGAILTCSVHLYFANLCLHSMFPTAKSFYLKFINAAVLYVLDIFVLVDLNEKIRFFCGFMCDMSIAVQVFTLVVLIGIVIHKSISSRRSKGGCLLNCENKSQQKKRIKSLSPNSEVGL